jgi:hypothetical protein
MNQSPIRPFSPFPDRVETLILAAEQGKLSDIEMEELDRLMQENSQARRFYAEYIVQTIDLISWAACADFGECPTFLVNTSENRPIDSEMGTDVAVQFQSIPSPLFAFFSTTIHNAAGYLSSDWLVSYLVAAVIFGVGSLITSHIYISPTEQIAGTSPSTAPASVPAVVQPERKLVGQVTGLVDCRWSDSHRAVHLGHRVAAGDEFVIVSGLAEITYDTDAKVLLQGPVTYRVDSPRGGFLSVGKLTARVEKKGTRDQESNPQSLISNPPIFAVRTPTAVVTDLGTEFGVEVKDNGETRSHVFRGSVQLQQTGVAEGKETPGNTIILHANEAASVKFPHGVKEKSAKENTANENELVLSRSEFDAMAFVLPDQLDQYAEEQRLKPFRRWQAYSQQLRKDPSLVAYYDFQMKDGNCSVLPNLSAAGSVLDGRVDGGDWVEGRLPGKMAFHFHGYGSGNSIRLPHPDRFEFPGAFSVAVWFKANTSDPLHSNMLITKGEYSWRLVYSEGPLCFHTNNPNVPKTKVDIHYYEKYFQQTNGHINIADNRWHLGVVVYEPQNDKMARKQVYIDGRLDVEDLATMPREKSKSPVWMGASCDAPYQVLSGLIDEAAFFSRVLSAEEVAAMFRAGNLESRKNEQKSQ